MLHLFRQPRIRTQTQTQTLTRYSASMSGGKGRIVNCYLYSNYCIHPASQSVNYLSLLSNAAMLSLSQLFRYYCMRRNFDRFPETKLGELVSWQTILSVTIMFRVSLWLIRFLHFDILGNDTADTFSLIKTFTPSSCSHAMSNWLCLFHK